MMEYHSEPVVIDDQAARKAMIKLARDYKKYLRSYWTNERSPIDNRKWKRRKDNLPHPILNKTGNMMRSVIFKADNLQLVAKMVDYGIFHQVGTEKMEARPWIGLTEEALEFFVDAYLEEIIK